MSERPREPALDPPSAAGGGPDSTNRDATVGGGRGDLEIVLYRCPTPTDYLCPCGTVARRLRRLGVEHRTERVPRRRADRPEIGELTKQDRVPVLIDGDEVIHDSRRIVQYLEWARERDRAEDKARSA